MQTHNKQEQLDEFLSAINNETLPEVERQQAARHYIELAVGSITADTVADDDPRLDAYSRKPGSPVYSIYPEYSLAEKKAAVAENRKREALYTIIGNESLPLTLRREAAVRTQSKQPDHLRQLLVDDFIERNTPHPNRDRLNELAKIINDRSPVERKDAQSYLTKCKDALAEFKILADIHPRRQMPVLYQPEQAIAFRFSQCSGESSSTYVYALGQLGVRI